MRRGPEAINWQWDPVLALGVMVVAVAGSMSAGSEEALVSVPSLHGAGIALLVVASLAIVVRRRYPMVVAALGALCAGTYFLVVNDNIAAAIPAAIGLYTLSSQGYRARAIAIIVGCTAIAVGTAVVLASDPIDSIHRTGGRMGWMTAIMIAGEVTRHARRNLAQARARAREAERARDEAELRQAAEERVRIARELHDSLTHSISVINVQSAVALHMLPDRPAQAEEAVRHIKSASQDAMRELRATLGTLRISEVEANPTLSGLSRLLVGVRAAGIDVELREELTERLPAEIDAAAFRIIQESLTNVVRHAEANSVTVTIRLAGGVANVEVVDDGHGCGGDVEGYGVVGMRERAEALGGRLTATGLLSGGFAVRAELPVPVREPVA
ncbi:sensor histidine kinase [Stackebrandtia soli]|uniref:sensor histidine kinase n=1 Tax=Stackebrandtia soli TaxID=1892856 RepID=UPI0039EBF2A7